MLAGARFFYGPDQSVTGLAIGSLLGAVGYTSMYFVTDFGDPKFLPLFVLLGIGQTACNLSAQALVGQESRTNRAASLSVASAFAARSVLYFPPGSADYF